MNKVVSKGKQSSRVYCIDTCSILQRSRVYPPDVFPDLWTKIDDLITQKRLISSSEVYRELVDLSLADDAEEWAKARKHMFMDVDPDIEAYAIPIIQRYQSQFVNYRTGVSQGDPWVVATAQCFKCVVVTEEVFSGGPARVKIPNVCADLGVECLNLLGLMREEKWQFRS